MMTLEEIYRALGAEPLPAPLDLLGDGFAHQTALGLLTRIEGIPLRGLGHLATEIAVRYPFDRVPDHARPLFENDLRRYRSWRRLVFDSLTLGFGHPVDPDPWTGVYRLASFLHGKRLASAVYNFRARLPAGTLPRDVTTALAHDCDRDLSGSERQSFRRGALIFDSLFGQDAFLGFGLLPSNPIGGFPDWEHHMTQAPLPPKLEEAYEAAPARIRAALPFIWHIALRAKVFCEGDNPSGEHLMSDAARDRLIAITPAEFGFSAPSEETYRSYITRLTRYFRPDAEFPPIAVQRRGPAAVGWHDFRSQLRACGVSMQQASVLSVLSTRAEKADLGPSDLTPGWCAEQEAGLHGPNRNAFRTACFLVDEAGDLPGLPPSLLPATPLGLERKRARPGGGKKPRPAKGATEPADPVEAAWSEFFRRARHDGVSASALHPLYTIRSAAQKAGLRPCDLRPDWLASVRDSATRSQAAKLNMACRLLDTLKERDSLAPLLPTMPLSLPDRRRSAASLSKVAMVELDRIIALQGVSESTARTHRIAVKALAEVTGAAPEDGKALHRLLARDPGSVDWQQFSGQATRYSGALRTLRIIAQLSRHAQWHRLQAAVVAAGVASRDNPVPYFFTLAEGDSPGILTAYWVTAQARAFRSTVLHPPHGRADLAETLAANAARLDGLHKIPCLRDSGLLPPRLGVTG